MDTEEVAKIIQNAIDGAIVHVMDPQNDGQHLEALVISDKFAGIPMVQQQRMVLKPLRDAFDSTLHALSLKTFSPDEWESNKHRFNM